MTSPEKITVNRANSAKSTGPRTARGKYRVSSNAITHGLNIPVSSDPVLCGEAEILAKRIAGERDCSICLSYARQIADARFDYMRARRAMHDVIARCLSDPNYHSASYHRDIEASRKRRADASDQSDAMGRMMIDAHFLDQPQSPPDDQKFIFVLRDQAAILNRLERYVRRALSRRKAAVRQFDAACAQFTARNQASHAS